MVVWFPTIAWGVAGGLTRALIGLKKALIEKRKIRWGIFSLTLLESAALGAVFGYFLREYNPMLNFFVGVGGTYLIDNVQRLIKFASIKIPVK